MFAWNKLLLLFLFSLSGIAICASTSIANSTYTSPLVFYYYKDFSIIRYTDSSNLYKLLWLNQINVISLEYYQQEKTFFFTTSEGELYSFVWNDNENENEDKSVQYVYQRFLYFDIPKGNAKLLFSESNWYPRSIALDPIGKKLYIADTNTRSIDVFDLDGKNKARLFVSDSVIPYEIVVDPSEGLMFFYAINFFKRKAEIHRMNMDGSDHQLIKDNIEITTQATLEMKEISFAIDEVNKQLYYKSGTNDVRTVDYNGHGGLLILKDQPVGIFEINNHRLYWLDKIAKNIGYTKDDSFSINDVLGYFKSYDYRENHLLTWCDLSHRVLVNSSLDSFYTCEPVVDESYTIKYANAFKIVDLESSKTFNNPCLENDHGCEDHCLLKSSGSSSDKKLSFGCACRLGRKMNKDEKTCSESPEQKVEEESVPYVYEKVGLLYNWALANITNDKADDTSVIKISQNFAKRLLIGETYVAWDDALMVKLTVTRKGNLKKTDGDVSEIIIPSSGKIARVLAYDWVSKNVYFAKLSNSSNDKYNLVAIPAKNSEKEILLGEIDAPISMAVHPYRGYLFISTFNETKGESHIIRVNTDGSDMRVIAYSNNTETVLALDFGEDKIYWIDRYYKKKNKIVMNANLDGSNANELTKVRFSKEATFITLNQEHIFIKTSKSKLYIFNKAGVEYNHFDTEDLGSIIDKMFKIKLNIKKTDTQYINTKDNPCANNNGGCETFCFAVPANDSQKLQRRCEEGYRSSFKIEEVISLIDR